MKPQTMVIPNRYQDSVKLMKITQEIKAMPGITRATAIMGTENNKATLVRGGFEAALMHSAGSSDILLIVEGESPALIQAAFTNYQKLLDEQVVHRQSKERSLESIASAASILTGANLALVSVPGNYAAYEAFKALRSGLHVQIFSDNVGLKEEVKLKKLGQKLGLLVMGPDCGTSIINGIPVGFANAVSRGPVGIVGASGTGMQELSVIVDRLGSGISQAIGLGGRDLADEVGGISALMALDMLEKDEQTTVVILVSKPAGVQTTARIKERLASYQKPVVITFLGSKLLETGGQHKSAATLEEAAHLAVGLAGGILVPVSPQPTFPTGQDPASLARKREPAASRKFLRGLFTGGTLAQEAHLILKNRLTPVYSNISKDPELKIGGSKSRTGHSIIDMGDDEFTAGRPHPMIDPSYRADRLVEEWADPEVAVILCDLVLGYGSHADPAASLVAAIESARSDHGNLVTVVASICGTEADPQSRSRQEAQLRKVGVLVYPTNAAAARAAGELVLADTQGGKK